MAQRISAQDLVDIWHQTVDERTMTTVNLGEPVILDGGRAIAFTFLAVGCEARGQVSRDALEQYFWLQPAADESRMLKTFANGYSRIVAVACRLALRKGALEVRLDASDFQ